MKDSNTDLINFRCKHCFMWDGEHNDGEENFGECSSAVARALVYERGLKGRRGKLMTSRHFGCLFFTRKTREQENDNKSL